MAKLWDAEKGKSSGSRAGKQPEAGKLAEAFTVGNDHILDRKLLPFDLRASGVHARALQRAGLLSEDECSRLQTALGEILSLWERGEFEILPGHEDGHTAIELWLTDKLGDLGKKIHTGRSRNDQVLTAVRLFERESLERVLKKTAHCAGILLEIGETNAGVPMPGYTHTRRAMLSSAGQWAGGYAELMIMQLESSSGIRSLINRNPLGTAAGFGTTLDLDRDAEAEELGFDEPIICATAAQLSRGWVELQLVQYLAGITLLLNRLAGDIIRFSSEAYRFFELGEVVCTGSSIMPQKRNPDVAELIRGKHSVMEGYAATLQGVIRNLGSGYHRDLQLTKEPVMLAFDLALELLEATDLLLQNLTFNRKELKKACSAELQAAETAYRLVSESGLSFRDAYQQVKSGEAEIEPVDPEERLKEYTQLGSPGNPGLDRLKEKLKHF